MEFNSFLSYVHCVLELCYDVANSIKPNVNEQEQNTNESNINSGWGNTKKQHYINTFDSESIQSLSKQLDKSIVNHIYSADVVNNFTHNLSNVMLDAAKALNIIKEFKKTC